MFESARSKSDSVEVCLPFSLRTTNSHASSSLMRLLLGHSSPAYQMEGSCEQLRLKTLEEHRFATRFQEKRVTLQTWRKAKKEAFALIASGDRPNLVEALYLLLEIIWLRPRGCSLPPLYLNAGSIYLAFDHLEEAATSYRNYLRLDPNSWKAQYNLGITLARAQDFVDAKHQFDLALQNCPSDATVYDDIHAMVAEIKEIVQGRNERAFKDTDKAREFTSQHLRMLHSVAAKPSELARTSVPEDYTSSCHSGTPAHHSPLLFHNVDGWQGAIAELLHRLYTSAFTRSISVDKEFARVDPFGSGCISIEELETVVFRVTSFKVTTSEHTELMLICRDGKLLHQLLVPNVETLAALDEMSRVGVFHAALRWRLTQKRAKRSEKARQGGFWYWMELPMAEWIAQMELSSTLVDKLCLFGWMTPMDLVLRWNRLDPAGDSLSLSFADRGVFVFECHRVHAAIQNEALTVLQMFFRRLVRNRRRTKSYKCISQAATAPLPTYKRQSSAIGDLRNVVHEDTQGEQEIAAQVLECLDKLVNDVVAAIRLESKDYEESIRWQEIPVRTEKRQATSQAVGMLQNLMATRSG